MNTKSGKVEYVVTMISVDGVVKKPIVHTVKELNELVKEINTEVYWSVQSVEKFKRYTDFIYEGEVLHTPLHFKLDGVSETDNIGTQPYSFLLKDKSLSNVKRVHSKGKQ